MTTPLSLDARPGGDAPRPGGSDVLEVRDVDRPALGDGQVLVRVHASSVNPVEWYGVSGPYFARIGNGMRRPKDQTVGADLAGTVEAVGREVKALQPGDEVFGVSGASWAEYTLAREDRLARKPSNLSFEEAAAVPVAAVTALQALRDKGQVQPGQKVLVNGASGGVGTFAVQLAKTFGADVTAVCSTGNMEQARSLGADRVVDYTKQDFTILKSRFRSQKVTFFVAKVTTEELTFLAGLLEAGTLKSVIDRKYELSEAPVALAYLGEGHARAKVVITA